MQEVFAKIIEKLEERTSFLSECTKYGNKDAEQQNKSYSTMMMYEVADLVDDLIEIVKQAVEEFGTDTNVRSNGWIPVSDGLPKIYEESMSSDIMLVLGHDKAVDYYWQAMGWYSETAKKWFFAECKNTDKQIDWIDIIAWQPLPAPYQPNGE